MCLFFGQSDVAYPKTKFNLINSSNIRYNIFLTVFTYQIRLCILYKSVNFLFAVDLIYLVDMPSL